MLRFGVVCPNPECPGRTGEPAEYREGVTHCHDCGAALVDDDPEPDAVEYEQFVPVREILNAALVPVVKSLLASENVRFFIKGEGVQDLFGWGRFGAGFNIIAGPPVVYAEPERAEEARELLDAAVESPVPDGAPSDDDDPA